MKEILNISAQIDSLSKNKSIDFENENQKEDMRIFLQRNNYLNVISLKYLFANGQRRENNRFIHTYSYKTRFKILKKKYNELLKFENKLRDSILSYETELKVHLDEYFKTILKNKEIGFREYLQKLYRYDYENRSYDKLKSDDYIFKKFDKEWKSNITKFSHSDSDWNNYFYLLLKIQTFGMINDILCLSVKTDDEEYKTIYELFNTYLRKTSKFKIGNRLSELKTIGILRNALCHKESLIIFLEKGFRAREKKDNKKTNPKGYKRDFLKERADSINIIYKYFKELNGIRNKNLPKDCWILKYADYRLRNGKRINFKKLKINL